MSELKCHSSHQSLRFDGILCKANLTSFAIELDEKITYIDPRPKNFKDFWSLLKLASSNNIPRGYMKTFTCCWQTEVEAILKEYEETGNPDTATQLSYL